jgi:LPS-assembly protein
MARLLRQRDSCTRMQDRSRRENAPKMTTRFCWCITLYFLCHPQVWAQTLTKQFPPAMWSPQTASQIAGEDSLPANLAPDVGVAPNGIPVAQVVPPIDQGVPVHISAQQQGKRGDVWTLSGDVEIDYRDYVIRADKITYNEATSIVEAEGHLHLEGGRDNEDIHANHGTIDTDRETGHFFDVSGSIGARQPPVANRREPSTFTSAPASTRGYSNNNPLLFAGRELFKDGPERYRVIDGWMTSCQLPDPDWLLLSSKINVADGTAKARNAWFTLLRVPLFFLPYVNHPVNADSRQTGFLIPTIGTSSTKGLILGDEIYWVINRSADLTFGSEYYSKRGFAPRAEFRYRGSGNDFLTVTYRQLLDRGLPSGEPGVPPINQGGEDVTIDGRRDFSSQTRAVSDIEYLSSYVYRQAFAESFALATSSEVKSDAFLQNEEHGIAKSIYFGRYQSFESNVEGDEIRILHLPSAAAEAVDHSLAGTPLLWGFQTSVDVLTRSEPQFHARNVFRADLYPHLAAPFSLGGWTFRPEVAGRETFYTRSEQLPALLNGDVSPTLVGANLNRADFEAGVDIRPPAVQRDFSAPWLEKLLGGDLRHSIEPDLQYRYVTGINNFNSVLRVDQVDVASNTNELEYGLTQRLFVRHLKPHPCRDDEAQTTDGLCGGGTLDWLTWTVAQKYFFNPNFGGAVIPGQSNVLTTTLDFTGTAFLDGPRDYSPVISRLRLRTTSATDFEWDLDYDTKTGRINSSNVFAGYRHDNYYVGIGDFKLDVLQTPTSTENIAAAITNYNQLRFLFTYGSPTRKGFSFGANAGYDFVQSAVQFGGIETNYNWDCCGVSAEYRRYALGSVRNENQYLFSFTLAGVGTAGNLRRAVRIF